MASSWGRPPLSLRRGTNRQLSRSRSRLQPGPSFRYGSKRYHPKRKEERMSVKTLQQVLARPKPTGLQRLLLSVLAFRAAVNGQVKWSPRAQEQIRAACAMKGEQFDRTLRELHAAAWVEIAEDVLVIPPSALPPAVSDGVPQQELGLPTERKVPEEQPTSAVSRDGDVDRIISTYVEVMQPRKTWQAGEEERRIVRAALKVATVEECCNAIRGCRASGYHMGDNPRGRKYNKLSHILKGKQGKKTTREQIDMFLDTLETATAVGTTVQSGDPAIIAQRKEDVRRGHRSPDDSEAVRKAEEAEAWLRQHGVVTRRRTDGYPLWGGE